MKAMELEDFDQEIRDVEKRMRRFIETGDFKRLAILKGRLAKLQADLYAMRTARTPPSFRKSYSFEAWREALANGCKPFYDLMYDLEIV